MINKRENENPTNIVCMDGKIIFDGIGAMKIKVKYKLIINNEYMRSLITVIY
jgi:hypothetical protein